MPSLSQPKSNARFQTYRRKSNHDFNISPKSRLGMFPSFSIFNFAKVPTVATAWPGTDTAVTSILLKLFQFPSFSTFPSLSSDIEMDSLTAENCNVGIGEQVMVSLLDGPVIDALKLNVVSVIKGKQNEEQNENKDLLNSFLAANLGMIPTLYNM